MSYKLEMLQAYFGYGGFLPGQERAVDALLAGKDVLSIMPTGAGKSLCFQLPAIMLPGVALVISPLISLMKDQVRSLVQAGIPAAYLNRSLTERQYALALERAWQGRYKIIYVAPERLESPGFLRFAQRAEISMVAVDEAHCVSQWGADFRPSYLKIPAFLQSLPKRPPLGAFTATATPEVREDILQKLDLRDPVTTTTGFDRSNLYFEVRRPQNRKDELLSILLRRQNESGVVYCSTRKSVEEVCIFLSRSTASPLPATMPGSPRRSGRPIRTLSPPTNAPSWWPPTPSAWGSTSPMCAMWSTTICPWYPGGLLSGGRPGRTGWESCGLHPALQRPGCGHQPVSHRPVPGAGGGG